VAIYNSHVILNDSVSSSNIPRFHALLDRTCLLSILGPLLFILYINDGNISKDAELLLFADDTNVFLYDTDICQLSVRANSLKHSHNINRFKLNRLSVNVKKCNFILFTTRPITADYKVSIDNSPLERVRQTKFLGVIINEKLTCDDHISLLCNQVSKNIGILRRIKNKIPVSLLRNLYFTLINAYFECCNVIWAISSSIALVKLYHKSTCLL